MRIALIAKELAQSGLFRVSMIVGDHGQPHIEQRDGVTLYSLIKRHLFGVSLTITKPTNSITAKDHIFLKQVWRKKYAGISTIKRRLSRITPFFLKQVWRKKYAGISTIKGIFSRLTSFAKKLKLYRVTSKMISIYKEVNADIYIVPGNSHFSYEVAFYCKRYGKKYVFLAGSDFDYFPEYKQYPNDKDIYGVPFAVKTQTIGSADAHFVQSERQAALLHDGYGRIGTVIKNPIDLKLLFPRELTVKNILWVGKSDERIKRPSLVLELARQLPHYPFIIILNLADEKTHTECLELAKQLPNVTLIERVPFEEVERYFANAKLHLNTSLFEGFPNTFLHAAKYGVPTISIQVDPADMLLQHGSGLVSNGDFKRFKENVCTVMADSILHARLSRQALDYVRKHHDKKKIMDQYTQALQALLKKTT